MGIGGSGRSCSGPCDRGRMSDRNSTPKAVSSSSGQVLLHHCTEIDPSLETAITGQKDLLNSAEHSDTQYDGETIS